MVRRNSRRKQPSRRLINAVESDRDINKAIFKQLSIGQGNSLPLIPDVPKLQLKRNKVITLSRSVSKGTITSSATLPVFGAITFQMQDLPLSSEFTSLFDQYKFQQVIVKFIPVTGQSNTNAFHLMPLMTVIDYDDNNTPTSLDYLRQYNTLAIVPSALVTHTRVLAPKVAPVIYSNTVANSYGSSRVWIDSASPTVGWFGVKWGMDTNGTSPNVCFQIEAEYIISFRNTI